MKYILKSLTGMELTWDRLGRTAEIVHCVTIVVLFRIYINYMLLKIKQETSLLKIRISDSAFKPYNRLY
jgi:hypothetical protein